MTNEIDEDLIKQTIQRVADQKRALAAAAQGLPDQREAMGAASVEATNDDEEDRIAATIRRVAEQKAAMTASAAAQDEPGDEAPEASVSESHLQAALEAADGTLSDHPHEEAEEEDPIEATIRRVAAQKAARAQQDDDWDDEPAAPRSIEPVAQPAAATRVDDDDWSPRPLRAVAGGLAPSLADPSPWDSGDSLAASTQTLASLVSRLEAILPALERLASPGAPPNPRPAVVPQRPQIFKDTVAPAQPEPDRIDTRPIPKPLPPLQAETRRGFDLLPRTYRITVEDKRRGVDLVPLHRALLGMNGVRDMSLLSYNNGIAIVSLVTTTDIDPDDLGAVVSRAMSREARVEQHNELTLVVKLAED